MSRDVRKPGFCICENKDADQLLGNREDDQRLCFRYTDSKIPLLPKSEISSPQPSSVIAQPGLCQTWSESPKTGFLTSRLKLYMEVNTPCFDMHKRELVDKLWQEGMSFLNMKYIKHLSPDFCICENKDADQLRGNREADLRLCFRICKNPVFSRRGSYFNEHPEIRLFMEN